MSKEKDKRLAQFGSHVRGIRKELGLSQDKVAINSNLTKSNLSEIERGNRNLAFTTLLELAKGLGVHPKKLLDYEEKKEKE
ncbi:MAG TPA: helix-turn-helix transcriptional regulator [Flavobacterium sp.]|uniref:helix-turn-helix domain-containing protein n=1 Tax=unclassified Flavobacterium TaxID=196869 RepID=UPI0025B7AE83|nr:MULTISPECIES: helix-turn-helix transcriptional regulator [unclassified Flavobacterium]HRE76786.1 helix-turn-helix transcriptional regulator [Flavobacterium sp.]